MSSRYDSGTTIFAFIVIFIVFVVFYRILDWFVYKFTGKNINLVRSILYLLKSLLKEGLSDEIQENKLNKSVSGDKKELNKLDQITLNGVFFGKIPNEDRIKYPNQDSLYVVKQSNSNYHEGHVLVVGGTGSGKSLGVIVPTLIFSQSNVFCIDIKGELVKKAGKYREQYKVFNFGKNNFTYDVLLSLRNSDDKFQEAKLISNAIIPLSIDEKNPFWIESARNLFSACLILWQSEDFPQICKKVLSYEPRKLIDVISENEDIKILVNPFLSCKDEILSSIMLTLSNNITVYATDKGLIKSCKRKDEEEYTNITPKDLLRWKCDIFLQVDESKIEYYKNFINLMVSQFIGFFERIDEGEERLFETLFIIDEFPRLGKIEVVLNALATLRSKRVVICLFIQSLAHLDLIYGEEARKIICDSCNYKLVLKAMDADTQEYFSRLVGTYDSYKEVNSFSYGTSFVDSSGRSDGLSYTRNSGINFGDNRVSYSSGQNKQWGNYSGISEGETETSGVSQQIMQERIIKPEDFAYLNSYPVLFTPYGVTRIIKTYYFNDFNNFEQNRKWGALINEQYKYELEYDLEQKIYSYKVIINHYNKSKPLRFKDLMKVQEDIKLKILQDREHEIEYEFDKDYYKILTHPQYKECMIKSQFYNKMGYDRDKLDQERIFIKTKLEERIKSGENIDGFNVDLSNSKQSSKLKFEKI